MSARIDVIQDGYSVLMKASTVDASISRTSVQSTFQNVSIDISSEPSSGGQRACGSCCLVRSSNQSILFDTMGPWDKDSLLEKLQGFKIHPDDINFVVGSHGHADHIGNLNLFTKCKRQFIGICSYFEDIYYDDHFNQSVDLNSKDEVSTQTPFTYVPSFKIDNNLCIVATPGHTNDDVSLMIENCDNLGKVALAGDLFERAEDVENESIWMGAGSMNPTVQRHNRALIYAQVDWILPGHGPIFKTNQDIRLHQN